MADGLALAGGVAIEGGLADGIAIGGDLDGGVAIGGDLAGDDAIEEALDDVGVDGELSASEGFSQTRAEFGSCYTFTIHIFIETKNYICFQMERSGSKSIANSLDCDGDSSQNA